MVLAERPQALQISLIYNAILSQTYYMPQLVTTHHEFNYSICSIYTCIKHACLKEFDCEGLSVTSYAVGMNGRASPKTY